MIKVETINYQDRMYDAEFVSKCMSARVAEVTSYPSKDAKVLFSVKTKKNHKDDYISITIRTQDGFGSLEKHIQELYGGYIIPIMNKINPKKNPESAAEEYQNYLNSLIQHRAIRSDPVLFAFCFVQQKQDVPQSRYQRFLTNAVQISRKHLSKLLTRQDKLQHSDKDDELQKYRQVLVTKKKEFQSIKSYLYSNYQQQQCLYYIKGIIDKNESFQHLAISKQLRNKCQKITSIFLEIEAAYSRRAVLLQQIKQLKANNIRHKYNSKHQSTEKVLEIERNKYISWSQLLSQEMQCTLMVLDSYIREVISRWLRMQRMAYEDQQAE